MNNSGNSSSMPVPRDLSQGSSEGGTAKPRGRPSGSKNKPKEESKGVMAMKLVTLEVPPGVDIINWVASFANSNEVCITVTVGFGEVSLAVLSNRLSQDSEIEYNEHLTMHNFSGMYVYSPLAQVSPTFFNATLSRGNGEFVSGTALRMVTMDKVVLSAYVFQNPDLLTVKTESN